MRPVCILMGEVGWMNSLFGTITARKSADTHGADITLLKAIGLPRENIYQMPNARWSCSTNQNRATYRRTYQGQSHRQSNIPCTSTTDLVSLAVYSSAERLKNFGPGHARSDMKQNERKFTVLSVRETGRTCPGIYATDASVPR